MKISNKRTIQAVIVILSLVVALVYLYVRVEQINSTNSLIAKFRTEKQSMAVENADQGLIEKMFPKSAGIALFVDNLYEAARMAGIKRHAVSTLKTGDVSARRNVKKGVTGESGQVLKTYVLKISLEGNYRDTAEYIREVQNIERYKRIVEFAMRPADKLLKTDITIEIYSVGGQDVAQ